MALYKVSEWQGGSGQWYVNDTSHIASWASKWWAPARILNISPASFVQLLIDKYKPDRISFKDNVLLYSWNPEHYNLAHSYLLWLNKEARNRNIQV